MIDLLQAFVEAFLRIFKRDAAGTRSSIVVAGAILGVVFFALLVALVLFGSLGR